ncbi:MAG: AAA family ATPase [Simplicispira sp.]|nr:AAA family ATPase [Simplicispira sp.]
MVVRRRPRHRQTSDMLPAGFTPEMGAPIARLWILRLLSRGGPRLLKQISDHAALAQHLGVALEADPHDEDEDAGLPPDLTVALIRRLLRSAEADPASHTLPEPLASNIGALTEELGLDETAAQVLAFCMLLANDSQLEECCNALGNLNDNRTMAILEHLLGLPLVRVRGALAYQGPLHQSGLLRLDHHNHYMASKFDLLTSEFAARMVHHPVTPIEVLRGLLNLAPAALLQPPDYAHIAADLQVLVPYLQHTLDAQRPGVNTFLYGPPGTGKTQLTRLLGVQTGCPVYEVACEDSDGDPISGERRLRAWQIAQVFLKGQRALLVFDEAEDVFNDGGSGLFSSPSTATKRKGWMNQRLESSPVPTLWLSNSGAPDAAFTRRFDMVFALVSPPRQQRHALLAQAAGPLLGTPALERLAGIEALAPAVVERAARVVRSVASTLAPAQHEPALLRLIDQTLSAQGHGTLRQLHNHRPPPHYDPALTNTDQDPARLLQGLAHAGSARLCLYGAPGTGKTAFAQWLAEQLERPLLVKRASDLLSKWVGQAEKNIAAAFDSAQCDNAVLLIDEVDSFLRDRRGAKASWEVTQVNEMLTQMEQFEGIFIASTNLMDGFDPAALRRFDLKLRFDPLRPEQALALLQTHCRAQGWALPEDALGTLAQLPQLTPGDFAAALRQHRFAPLADAQALLALLHAECALKENAGRRIGFV